MKLTWYVSVEGRAWKLDKTQRKIEKPCLLVGKTFGKYRRGTYRTYSIDKYRRAHLCNVPGYFTLARHVPGYFTLAYPSAYRTERNIFS